MPPLIRPLDPVADLPAVEALYQAAADFWTLTDRHPPDAAAARSFFTNAPPGSDPARSQRLGLFVQSTLCGVAELAFDYPEPNDGFLGLMLLAPDARGRGLGPAFLQEVVARARAAGCPRLLLAVLQENPRARAFWERQGFRPTGIHRFDATTGHILHRLAMRLPA